MATEYLRFTGKVKYAQIYTPDEFRGSVRWKLNFYPEDVDSLKAVLNENKTFREDEDGVYTSLFRHTTKLMKGKLVTFVPPSVYDKDGNLLIHYVNPETGKRLNSFDDPKTPVERVGDPILIGNGSVVEITLSVYPTAMGNGNRLEAIRLIDLIEYIPPEETTASDKSEEENDTPPWE